MHDIETDGFLAPEALAFRDAVRVQFVEQIRECEDVSRRATTQVFEQHIANVTVANATAASLWARCLSASQAAILLAERGMGVEALALLRTAYENLFFCAALVKQPAVIVRLAGEDTGQRLKQAREMLKDKQIFAAITDADRALLEAFVRDTPAATKAISAYEAAEIAGMTGIYQGAWRTFSLIATHATLTGAGHAFGNDLYDLQFGPSFANVDSALGLARDCIRLGLDAVAPIFTA
ncbi:MULTISPECIES: DUF5677 domain-containing protein [Ralstonia solanacearum species complex]|uniref:Uncharacterized protein n=3 Tax=Ralstonia solanacearum species complex TaxID=3116862 RepID=A0ABF7RCH1_RALSL|nr:DUF5677 domain-containing protein [Ralstonia solanacearum]ALF88333.1 hypothetical protein RSUY_19980 [Ralstonia solanacearum]KEI31876.1 hypothetical protein CQ06_20100 [Ralstonia solanacearum]KFX76693.1 hypothetical protein KR98_23400 [Ralstonia solanacearum]KFX81460.1 hypothetical protein KR99_23065 [Ralstonia solanacearum]KFZ94914.1 hypothetical protein CR47_0206335 [Ralstonia solanacearum]